MLVTLINPRDKILSGDWSGWDVVHSRLVPMTTPPLYVLMELSQVQTTEGNDGRINRGVRTHRTWFRNDEDLQISRNPNP